MIVLPFEALWEVHCTMLLESLNHLHINAILTFGKRKKLHRINSGEQGGYATTVTLVLGRNSQRKQSKQAWGTNLVVISPMFKLSFKML